MSFDKFGESTQQNSDVIFNIYECTREKKMALLKKNVWYHFANIETFKKSAKQKWKNPFPGVIVYALSFFIVEIRARVAYRVSHTLKKTVVKIQSN